MNLFFIVVLLDKTRNRKYYTQKMKKTKRITFVVVVFVAVEINCKQLKQKSKVKYVCLFYSIIIINLDEYYLIIIAITLNHLFKLNSI
jgi:hypothetical protein